MPVSINCNALLNDAESTSQTTCPALYLSCGHIFVADFLAHSLPRLMRGMPRVGWMILRQAQYRFFSVSQRNLDYFGHPVPCEAGLSVFIHLNTDNFIH
jgi:hypothetical protein